MSDVEINKSMSLRIALNAARRLGCSVNKPRNTGEVLVVKGRFRVRVNCRRKDCPRSLITMLRKVEREIAAD